MEPQRDAAILASLPGVGRIVLATLLSEAYEPLYKAKYAALRAKRVMAIPAPPPPVWDRRVLWLPSALSAV